jgi:hypothetical protein
VPMGREKLHRWPLWAVVVVYVVVFWLLYEVWKSPRRNDLATYGAFAVAVVAILPGLLAWARRRSLRGVADDANLDRAVEELARAVQVQWEKAAGERGLTGADPIQVTWASPTLAISGPKAAAISSRRSETLPGLLPVGAAQVQSGPKLVSMSGSEADSRSASQPGWQPDSRSGSRHPMLGLHSLRQLR